MALATFASAESGPARGETAVDADRLEKQAWAWRPELPIGNAPLFAWPPRPVAALGYLLGKGFLLSPNPAYLGLAVLTWLFFGPELSRCAQLEAGWIAQVFAINLAAVVLVAGALHLYFYTFRAQGGERRLDASPLGVGNPKFFTGSQVRDNIFWTCGSGVAVWTGYQVAFMWAYANGLLPTVTWGENPVWFIAVFPLVVVWQSMHFYFVHRLLHWKPLFKVAHALHHRNVNIGPWSGFSMHPIEHLLYFSTIVLHLVIASHPIHMIFHMYFTALAAVTSHTGYSHLLVNGKPRLDLGDFFHQLHHRYFDCNYGTATMPWDKWFGSFHDGTAESTARVRQLQRERQTQRSRPEASRA